MGPGQAAVGGAAAGWFWADGDEGVLGESRRVAADRVVRNGQLHLVRRGWPCTKQFDEGRPGHQAEDETQSQETEFACCHAATFLKLVLLRLWGTTAPASVAARVSGVNLSGAVP
jgi:hypothetical protein